MNTTRRQPLAQIIRRLLQIAWPYRGQILLGWLCLGILSGLMFALSRVMIPLINIIAESDNARARTWLRVKEFADAVSFVPLREWFYSILGFLPDSMALSPEKMGILMAVFTVGIACSVAMAFTQFAAYYLTQKVAFRGLTDTRARVNEVLIHQKLGYYDRWKPGELMSKLQNDIDVFSQSLVFLYNEAPRALFTIVFGCVGAIITTPALALVLIAAPLFWVPLKNLGKKIKRSSRYTLEMKGQLNDDMHQQFGGIREIKGFRAEEKRKHIFNSSNESVFKGYLGVIVARAKSRALVEGGGHIIVFIALVAVIYFSVKYEYNVGELGSFGYIVFNMIMNPLRRLTRAYNNFQNSLPGTESVLGILDYPEPLSRETNPLPFPQSIDTIEFRDVSYSYRDGISVVEGIGFKVKRGETIAVVGPTGSGKSTLVDFIPRFRDPDRGLILINDIDVKRLDLDAIRDHVALVGQDPYLFNASIRENLQVGSQRASDEHMLEILKMVQLDSLIGEKEEGLGFHVGERGSRLSGGQRQRLAIARALLKDSPILILDEATSAQDSKSERGLQNALDTLMQGRTTFIIAHRLSTVRKVDRILVLKDGRLVESGNHETLKDAGGEYSSLYATQFSE